MLWITEHCSRSPLRFTFVCILAQKYSTNTLKDTSFPLHLIFHLLPSATATLRGKENISAKLVMLITKRFSGGDAALNGF